MMFYRYTNDILRLIHTRSRYPLPLIFDFIWGYLCFLYFIILFLVTIFKQIVI